MRTKYRWRQNHNYYNKKRQSIDMKKISANVLMALKNALSHIFWYKKDLKDYLYMSIEHKEVLSMVNWSDYKRNIASQVVNILERNEQVVQGDLLNLIISVATFNDYSSMKRVDDAEKKIHDAKMAVSALFQLTESFINYKEEEEIIRKRKQANKDKAESLNRVNQILSELKEEFIGLSINNDNQKRGYALEKFLNGLFNLYNLDAKSSFKIVGEQIDGAFSLDKDEYLLEAKWRKEPTANADLYAFEGKINRRLDNTLGLFISINGFSEDAITAYSNGKKIMYLMDGMDLMAVSEQRIPLPDLLRRKKRAAVQTGNIYLKVSEIL